MFIKKCKKQNGQALIEAVRNKNKEIVAVLLRANADVTLQEGRALEEAINMNEDVLFGMLVEEVPKKIEISAFDGTNFLQISLDFLRVDFPKNLVTPFAIPENYKKIEL